MERRFALPHQMMRITSLVPGDAADIRDATEMTFADVDRSSTRARTLVTTGMIVTALGGLLALVGIGRLIGQRLAMPWRQRTRSAIPRCCAGSAASCRRSDASVR